MVKGDLKIKGFEDPDAKGWLWWSITFKQELGTCIVVLGRYFEDFLFPRNISFTYTFDKVCGRKVNKND